MFAGRNRSAAATARATAAAATGRPTAGLAVVASAAQQQQLQPLLRRWGRRRAGPQNQQQPLLGRGGRLVVVAATRSSNSSADDVVLPTHLAGDAQAAREAARALLLGSGARPAATAAVTPSAAAAPPLTTPMLVAAALVVGVVVGALGSRAGRGKKEHDEEVAAAPLDKAPPPPPPAAPSRPPPPPAARGRRQGAPRGVSDAMAWYRRRLPRVHYVCGPNGAMLTRVAAKELGADVCEALRLEGGGEALIAFQDAADAEFVLKCMAEGKQAGGKSSGRSIDRSVDRSIEFRARGGLIFPFRIDRSIDRSISTGRVHRRLHTLTRARNTLPSAPPKPTVFASAAPAEIEARLNKNQALFVLPPGRLPIKAVKQASQVAGLLRVALLFDVADRAGTVAPSEPDTGEARAMARSEMAVAAATTTTTTDILPPPPSASSPRASLGAAEEDDDAQFAPVTLSPPQPSSGDLLEEFYRLDRAAAVDRLANVAASALDSIDSPLQPESPIDRSAESQSPPESIDRSTEADKSTTLDDSIDVDRSTVVRKGTRAKLPPPPPALAPEELQRSVMEAMKEVDPTRADERQRDSDNRRPGRLIGDNDSDEPVAWWKGRFRALYFPVVGSTGASGGSTSGFLQVDIAADGTALSEKDVRVVAFEDRYDAARCCATMEACFFMDGSASYSVGALAADKVESEIREAYLRAAAAGSAPTAPTGLVVFRKNKLPLKIGMSRSELVQAIVMQGAAQVALGRTGFKF
jgi:hypothetical protein